MSQKEKKNKNLSQNQWVLHTSLPNTKFISDNLELCTQGTEKMSST